MSFHNHKIYRSIKVKYNKAKATAGVAAKKCAYTFQSPPVYTKIKDNTMDWLE